MISDSPIIKELVVGLLEQADLQINFESIDVVRQGGNNQIYRVRQGSKNLIVKKYFQHPDDLRNRLEAEYSFLKFAYEKTPKFVPKPFAKNSKDAIALYEFIDGVKITNDTALTLKNLERAPQFISALNKRESPYSSGILNASEACFSIREHLNSIEGRVNELKACAMQDPRLTSILERISSRWEIVKERVSENCNLHNIEIDEILGSGDRILSPSDFGFHNAIIQNDFVKFIDFEYAGWDDPAKLVGDFFSQVEVPIDNKYLDNFVKVAFRELNFSEKNMIRSKLLVDAYKIKWCCIVLNIFHEKNLLRRLFANPNLRITLLKDVQIKKASKILESFANELH